LLKATAANRNTASFQIAPTGNVKWHVNLTLKLHYH